MVAAASTLTALMATSAYAANGDCTVEKLNEFGVPNTNITSAELKAATATVPEYCTAFGEVITKGAGVADGSARFQVSLPTDWNGKFLFGGGGGFDGLIYAPSAAALTKGYAVVNTDSGHVADPTVPIPSNDATWAVLSRGVPNKVTLIDYYHRSRHDVVTATKKIVKAFFKKPVKYSYMTGCSNGGHEGVVAAMKYPKDFDGIVAGNPWIDQPGNQLWSLRNTKALVRPWINPSKYPAIEKAVFDQCDAVDGVKDRLIQNPAKCAFDPDTLVPNVLSKAESESLKTYMTAIYDTDGNFVFPGSSVAGIGDTSATTTGLSAHAVPYTAKLEDAKRPPFPDGPQPWGSVEASAANWSLTYGFIKYMSYYNVGLNIMNSRVINDEGLARPDAVKLLYDRAKLGLADNPKDLSDFIAQDRKLLIYDGYADPVLNAYEKVLFYKNLARQQGGYKNTQQNVRMFMVPDMQHCASGTGPNSFDTLSAIEGWVERGEAPVSLLASHRTDGVVDRTMPICMFPRQAEFAGEGDVNDAANWKCPNNKKLLEVGPNGAAAGLDRP